MAIAQTGFVSHQHRKAGYLWRLFDNPEQLDDRVFVSGGFMIMILNTCIVTVMSNSQQWSRKMQRSQPRFGWRYGK